MDEVEPLFGCCKDKKGAVQGLLCPCYVVAKNGEFVGDNCAKVRRNPHQHPSLPSAARILQAQPRIKLQARIMPC